MLGGNYLRQALCCSDPFKAFEYVPALMNGFPMQARARQGKGLKHSGVFRVHHMLVLLTRV